MNATEYQTTIVEPLNAATGLLFGIVFTGGRHRALSAPLAQPNARAERAATHGAPPLSRPSGPPINALTSSIASPPDIRRWAVTSAPHAPVQDLRVA